MKQAEQPKSHELFNKDAEVNRGYLYTDNRQLSCRLATQRWCDTILETGRLEGRSVLDAACGDGFMTVRYWDSGRPSRMVATDLAAESVRCAARRCGDRMIRFLTSDGYKLPFADNAFDVVLLNAVLHHVDDPAGMMREALRVAPAIIILEPNGANPGLKVLEKTLPYHIEHGEKSYRAGLMKRWIREAGASVTFEKKAGFVPMFCPDWMARTMKFLEPAVERIWPVNSLACAIYVMVAVRK